MKKVSIRYSKYEHEYEIWIFRKVRFWRFTFWDLDVKLRCDPMAVIPSLQEISHRPGDMEISNKTNLQLNQVLNINL
jgi:hypothetical protein